MRILRTADAEAYQTMKSEELRQHFLIENLFQSGQLQLVYTDVDRAVVGGAMPVEAPLHLQAGQEMACNFFCERRELGVLNLGAAGTITVDGKEFRLAPLECLYIGRGSRAISFVSDCAEAPACFYLVSYPAHADYPTTHAGFGQANVLELGSPSDANRRTIRQYIHLKGIRSCQLVMGFTELHDGSVWNTYPPHTHDRRTEVYCYFDLPQNGCVLHLLGEPKETRHIVVREKQVVLSPAWSIHSGVGAGCYRFVWAMGGENQVFDDMDAVTASKLR